MKKIRYGILRFFLSFCIIVSCAAGFGITSGAVLTDINIYTPQSGSNDYISFSTGDYGGFDYNGYHSFNVNGIFNEKPKYTTCDDHGYLTAVKVGDNSRKLLPNDGSGFVYGKVYNIDGMQVRITASLESDAKSVLITYEVCNPKRKAYTVQFGSCSDIRIGTSDYQCTELLSKGIISKDISGTSDTDGAEIKIFPGNEAFDTRWYGSYDADSPDGGVLRNIFSNREDNVPYKDDGGLAWSWKAVIPAGETIKRTVQIGVSAERSYKVTYDPNGVSGEAPVDTKDYEPGASVTVRGQGSLVKGNDRFLGWNTKPDGSGTNYLEGDTFKIRSNVDLYAIWKTVNKSVLDDTINEAGRFYQDIIYNPEYSEIAAKLNSAIAEAMRTHDNTNISQNMIDAAQKKLRSALMLARDYVEWDEYRNMSIDYTKKVADKYSGTKTGTKAKDILKKLPGIEYDYDKTYQENINSVNDLVSPISNLKTSGSSSASSSSGTANKTKTKAKANVNLRAVLNDDHTVTVEWDRVADAMKYILYAATDSGEKKICETRGTGYTSSKTEKNNTVIKYRLEYNIGIGEDITPSGGKTTFRVYYKPVVKLAYKNGKITLSWKKVPNAEKYKVYRLEDGKFRLKLVTETVKSAVSIGKIQTGKTYAYAVTAVVNGEELPATRGDLAKITIE